MSKNKKIKDYQKQYRENMADEQKQRHREARNERDKDKYHNMTDEERKNIKIIKKNIEKNMSEEQKQKRRDHQKKISKKYER